MAALTVQKIGLSGAQKTALVAATVSGDSVVNEGKTFIEVINADASPITVTIAGQRDLPLDTSADQTIAVANGTTQLIGPFPVGNYNRETDESFVVTYSAVANITVGAFSVNDDYN
jgi:hypothetical protein